MTKENGKGKWQIAYNNSSLSELDREVATDSTREDISIESLRQSYCIEDGGVQRNRMLQDVT